MRFLLQRVRYNNEPRLTYGKKAAPVVPRPSRSPAHGSRGKSPLRPKRSPWAWKREATLTQSGVNERKFVGCTISRQARCWAIEAAMTHLPRRAGWLDEAGCPWVAPSTRMNYGKVVKK